MAVIALAAVFFMSVNVSAAQTHWFETAGTSSNENGSVIASSSGYLYVGGTTDLEDTSGLNAFLSKMSTDGTVSFFRIIGEQGSRENVTGIAADDSGYIYLVGYTNAFTPSDASSSVNAIFVAKFDSAGSLVWAEYIGATSAGDDDYGLGITYASDGYLYISGSYQGSLFVAKIDPNKAPSSDSNNVKWFNVYEFKAASSEPIGMAYSSYSNSLYLAFTTSNIYGSDDVAVLKIDTSNNGAPVWITTFGGEENDYATGLTLTGEPNGPRGEKDVVVIGSTNSFHILGTASYTDYNVFVAYLYSDDGNLHDPVVIGRDGEDDYSGNIVFSLDDVSLYFTGTTYSYGEVSEGYPDGFVAGLPVGQSVSWFKTVGGEKTEYMRGIVIGPDNYLYTAGYTMSFGEGGSDMAALLASDNLGNMTWTENDFPENVMVHDASPGSASFSPGTSTSTKLNYNTASVTPIPWSPTTDIDYSNNKNFNTHLATDDNTPDPVPEPWLVSMVTLGFLAVGVFLFSRRH